MPVNSVRAPRRSYTRPDDKMPTSWPAARTAVTMPCARVPICGGASSLVPAPRAHAHATAMTSMHDQATHRQDKTRQDAPKSRTLSGLVVAVVLRKIDPAMPNCVCGAARRAHVRMCAQTADDLALRMFPHT